MKMIKVIARPLLPSCNCHAMIIERIRRKFLCVVHYMMEAIIREFIPHLYDQRDHFLHMHGSMLQQASIGPFRGSIDEHRKVLKRPLEGLNRTAYTPLDTFQEDGDFILHLF